MRFLVVLFVITVTLFSSGCTLIGAGIGAAVPNYEPVLPESAHEGARVVVTTADNKELEGTFVTGDREVATLIDGHRRFTTSVARMRERRGSYWALGAGIGASLDVVVAILGVVAAVSLAQHPFSIGWGRGGFGY